MRKISLIFLLSLFLITVSSASEVVIEPDGNDHYLTFLSEDPVQIAGYKIILNYTAGTTVNSISAVDPYIVQANIQNDIGTATISGATGETPASNRLAAISYSGKGEFEIFVVKMVDMDLNVVTVQNAHPEPTPTPTSEPLPTYEPEPTYVVPGSGAAAEPTATGSWTPPKTPVPTGSATTPAPTGTTVSPTETVPGGEETPVQPAATADEQTDTSVPATSSTQSPNATQKSPSSAVLVVLAASIVGLSELIRKRYR